MGAEQSAPEGGGLVAAALNPSGPASTKNVDKRTSRRQHKAAFARPLERPSDPQSAPCLGTIDCASLMTLMCKSGDGGARATR